MPRCMVVHLPLEFKVDRKQHQRSQRNFLLWRKWSLSLDTEPSIIIECCVLPTLLFGAEFWILNTSLLTKLESFQAEIGKQILCLPKSDANNIICTALHTVAIHQSTHPVH